MTLATERSLADDESSAIAVVVREELARRRMTRATLALEAKISLSTLEKVLSGRRPFTLATIVRLEQALGVSLRRREPQAPAPMLVALPGGRHAETHMNGLAPEGLGSYARPGVSWIIGQYVTIRPSFGEPGSIYAYRTEIHWDEHSSSLAFREADRLDADFAQAGLVSVPHQSGHIYLVTNKHGQYRLIIVGRPAITGEMHGLLTTLKAGIGTQLIPTSTPIVLAPVSSFEAPRFGRITPDDPLFAPYQRLLTRTIEQQYAVLLGR
jgi:transcriptional regulator with XRE-family HTH domain